MKTRNIIGGALLALPFVANAGMISVDSYVEQQPDVGSVDYVYFNIDADSNVRLETFAPSFDSELFLFFDDGSLDSGDFITSNDDGGTPNSFSYYNSRINTFLSAGDYIAAVGDYNLTLSEAVSGINTCGTGLSNCGSYNAFGDYTLEIDAASANVSVSVPEPATLAMLGLGLMGVGAARRRAK